MALVGHWITSWCVPTPGTIATALLASMPEYDVEDATSVNTPLLLIETFVNVACPPRIGAEPFDTTTPGGLPSTLSVTVPAFTFTTRPIASFRSIPKLPSETTAVPLEGAGFQVNCDTGPSVMPLAAPSV